MCGVIRKKMNKHKIQRYIYIGVSRFYSEPAAIAELTTYTLINRHWCTSLCV